MTNKFNNIKDAGGIVAKAAAQTLKDNMVLCNTIDKADASDFNGKNGYKAGETIYTSKPARYIPQNTFDISSSIQDSVEEKAALTLDVSKTVGMEIDSFEFATEVELKDTIKRFVIPAAESIAQYAEQDFIEKATNATYNSVGTAGSNQFTVADVLAGKTKLDQNLAPMGDRHFLLNSASGALAVVDRKGLFQSASAIDKQYLNGEIGRTDGFDWYSSELINIHTTGVDAAGAVNDAAVSEGASTLTVDGFTGAPTEGTTFTIAGVNMVHPITKADLGVLQQFVVGAGSTNTVLNISPSLYAGSGGLQNVASLPADDAAVTMVGDASTSYAQNLQYHKNAFKMVSVPLIMPKNAEFASQETVDGLTVAVIRDFDVLARRMITRLDFLGGLSAVRPEHACKVTA